jgi:prefoldin subunit 5
MKTHVTSKPTHPDRAKSIRTFLIPLNLSFIFLLTSFFGNGQTLSDFQQASYGDGIKVIPYSDMRSRAGVLQGEKDRASTDVVGYNSRSMYDGLVNLLRIRTEVTDLLYKAKEKLNADDGQSPASTTALKDIVAIYEKELSALASEINVLDNKIDEGLRRWQALLNKRLEIDELFADVKDELTHSKSYPENHIAKPSSSEDEEAMDKYEDDVELLEGYIYKIMDTINRSTAEHVQVIAEAQASVDKLKAAQGLN